MPTFVKALIATFLLTEIAAVTVGTLVWVFMASLHASKIVTFSAEAVAGVGILMLAVVIFRKTMVTESDRQMEPVLAD